MKKATLTLLLIAFAMGEGCDTGDGAQAPTSDVVSDTNNDTSVECGKADSPAYCTTPSDDVVSADSTMADDASSNDTNNIIITNDPCKNVRVIEGEWRGIDRPSLVVIILIVESNMTCSLEMENDDHQALFYRTFYDVTDIPVEYLGQETGRTYQLDYNGDSILHQKIFSPEGELNGNTRLQR